MSVAPAVVRDAGMNDDNDNDDGMSPFLLGPVLTFLLPTESGPEGVGSEDAARQTGKHEQQVCNLQFTISDVALFIMFSHSAERATICR